MRPAIEGKMKRVNSASSFSSSSSGAGLVLETRYKGVRKRKWGKYVSEIRLPNSRERIWLGSYDSAEKAAKAFDAAMYCLRGRKAAARLNFPNQIPDIPMPRPGIDPPLSHAEIQLEAAKFAHAACRGQQPEAAPSMKAAATCAHKQKPVKELPPLSPAATGSDGSLSDEGSTLAPDTQLDDDLATMDWSFLDLLAPPDDPIIGFSDFRNFDFFPPPLPPPQPPPADDGEYLQPSFLWDF